MANELTKDLSTEKKKTPVEGFKENSLGLYGSIPTDLGSDTDHFTEESIQLLKHHGTYQQDNRDTRKARKKEGLDKEYSMMLRTKFPGGSLTAEQYLICDDLAAKLGNNDLRCTSRQCFQFRGVQKGNLRELINTLNTLAKITSVGACGDVVRNTMSLPVADLDPRYDALGVDLQALSKKISDHFFPSTLAYADIWIDDQKATLNTDGTITYADLPAEAVEEPIYGKTFLPRKFKIGVGTDFDNSSDVFTQDVGIIAITEDGKCIGFEITAGGGLGYSHGRSGKTYARSGTPIAFVQEDEVIPIIEAIVKIQRDNGDRTDRKHARLKYTIDDMGLDTFKAKIVEYAGREFPTPKGTETANLLDYLGWHKQTDGQNYVGVWVESGRIQDFEGGWQFKTGLRAVIEKFSPLIRLTPSSNLILANISDEDKPAVQALLEEFGIPTNNVSAVRKKEMACPALPMCPLATSEAERALPSIAAELENLGHGDADVVIRISGCPNGCPRPVSAEIGIVGKGTDQYCLHIGGNLGSRMNEKIYESVATDQLAPVLGVWFGTWKNERSENEPFGDWSHAKGLDALRAIVADAGIEGLAEPK